MLQDPLFPNPELFERCLSLVANKPKGFYAEFGVFRGDRFLMITKHARSHGALSLAFDSFSGMGKPTAGDGDKGAEQYPAGRFDVGGIEGLVIKLEENGGFKLLKDYLIIEGYVPESLKGINPNGFSPIRFAYVDLDHYEPTKAALEFILPRMDSDSIVLCDDDFGLDCMASLAYKEFLQEHAEDVRVIERIGRQFYFKRSDAHV
jgi:hypothetical protein